MSDAEDMLEQMADEFPVVTLSRHGGKWWLSTFTDGPDGKLESALFEYDEDRAECITKAHRAWRNRKAA